MPKSGTRRKVDEERVKQLQRQGLSQYQIAQRLGFPLDTIKKACRRIRENETTSREKD